ncbi:helix-turn-helix domain-containing protein [Streptomyces mexicanus]|uniref:helix-turn-helix domain-containing protein n=1 Tax=Streptomyces mexicanus TaxID=178566 RepID=UPI0036B547D4
MDTQNLSAPACAQPLNPRGVTHINTKHTNRFTVVGNHLSQHRRLSLTAIGLACHIQSLPSGARVDIKTLTDRFPEGETRIAAALRELETHGYLARIRERLPSGRIVTHTISYNQPRAVRAPHRPEPSGDRPPQPPAAPPSPPLNDPPPPEPDPAPAPGPPSETTPTPDAAPAPAAPPKPPLPEPQTPDLDRHRTATALLAGLHQHDPRLLLAERDVRHLAPAVAAWLEREVSPEAVRHALTANLPPAPRHPAALLAHRLTESLPPPPPPSAPASPRTVPLQNCDGCDRAFRAPEPGRCRECRSTLLEAA